MGNGREFAVVYEVHLGLQWMILFLSFIYFHFQSSFDAFLKQNPLIVLFFLYLIQFLR